MVISEESECALDFLNCVECDRPVSHSHLPLKRGRLVFEAIRVVLGKFGLVWFEPFFPKLETELFSFS